MSQPKLDQILDDFYDGVFLTEQPKAKQAIKDLMLEIIKDTPVLGPPHPQTDIYKEQAQLIKRVNANKKLLKLIATQAKLESIKELESLPFTERETGCMNCLATSIIDQRINELKEIV